MRAIRFAFAVATSLLFAGLSAASCADSTPIDGTGGDGGSGASHSTGSGAGTGTGNGGALPTSICLLHNCSSDIECEACTNGKTTCLVEEHRCVACNAGSSGGCPEGEKCSSWGNCAPETATCPTDNGVPTITCNQDSDCAACDPAHQICDPVAHKCVSCVSGNTSECQSNDTCLFGDCAPKCPESCTDDVDCAECGSPGAEAHFCNAHRCSSCSSTGEGCEPGLVCTEHGTCEATCGVANAPQGDCQSDSDCAGCEVGANKCHVPIGGGKGTCGPLATGCSDLGNGVAVLPSPFDKVTNLCSNDTDCSNISLDLNVGKILRDLTGFEQIHDAVIKYPMHACASVSILDKSCGVCVPCKVDSDCQNLNIDEFAGQAFGPLGAIGSAFLLDQIFGNDEHVIHMYCETVVSEYGVCVPCPGLLNDCSVGELPPDNGNQCHDVCTLGEALRPACDSCVANVCMVDPFCCTTEWDQFCADEVGSYCSKVCETCGQSDQGGHDKCQTGGPLQTSCSPCVWSICQADESCCTSNWSQNCIDYVPQYCEPAYLCQGQCNSADQCTGGSGCLADYTCGPCVADYDCFPKTCDTNSGQCQ